MFFRLTGFWGFMSVTQVPEKLNWNIKTNLRVFRASSHSNWRNWYPGQFYFHVIFVMLTWRWNESWSTWAFLTPTCLTSFRISTYYLGYWYSSVFVTWKSSLQKSMELIYTKKCKIQFSRIIRIFSQFQRWPLKEYYFTVILPRIWKNLRDSIF